MTNTEKFLEDNKTKDITVELHPSWFGINGESAVMYDLVSQGLNSERVIMSPCRVDIKLAEDATPSISFVWDKRVVNENFKGRKELVENWVRENLEALAEDATKKYCFYDREEFPFESLKVKTITFPKTNHD